MDQREEFGDTSKLLESLTNYSKIVRDDNFNMEAQIALDKTLYSLYENYSDDLKNDPVNPLLHTERGLFLLSTGKYQEAVADLTQAVKLEPENPLSYANRGLALAKAGEFALAIIDFTAALKFDTELTACRVSRAVAFMELGSYDEAMADLDYALEKEPDNRDYVELKNKVRMLQKISV